MEIPPGFPSFNFMQRNNIKQFSMVAKKRSITTKFGHTIYGTDVHDLRLPETPIVNNPEKYWLNDKIINMYLELLRCRPNGTMKVHIIDALFWENFYVTNYDLAKNLIRNVDLMAYDMVLVPIHHGNHWCLGIIWPNRRQIKFYNSSHMDESSNESILKRLMNFVKLRCEHYLGITNFDTTNWTNQSVVDIPQQTNSYDCGVFVCVYAEHATRQKFDFQFSQKHMHYFRSKILFEICTGRLLN